MLKNVSSYFIDRRKLYFCSEEKQKKKNWIEGKEDRQVTRRAWNKIYIISLACLFNPWIWTSFILQNLIIMNKKRKKFRKSQWTCKKKKKPEELQKRLRREAKTSGSKISVNLGREAGEWKSTSLKKKVQNTWEPLQCVRETAQHYWEGSS